MKYGFIRTAAVSPEIHVADVSSNAALLSEAILSAADSGAQIIVTPELSITCTTCGDLFRQAALLDAAEKALLSILDSCADVDALYTVGLPVRAAGKLYDCAAVCYGGTLLGVVPKASVSAASEINDMRIFASGYDIAEGQTVKLAGEIVPFGTNLLFTCFGFTAAVEIGTDLFQPCPPCTGHALAGADILLNPAAVSEIVGRDDIRRRAVQDISARLHCGYLYADANLGESSTDMVFAGHCIIAENGRIIAESLPFGDGCAVTELDIERLRYDRTSDSFPARSDDGYLTVEFPLSDADLTLTRRIPTSPFIPESTLERNARAARILDIQSAGLARRIAHAHCKKVVVGISGGLDSCLALIVSVHAMKRLNRPASDVVAITMPCFGTTKRTRSNAEILTEELGAELRTVNIADLVMQHFNDIGHDPENHNVVFENAQARARTYVLMDVANELGGMVVGTGDLSELALGWATYNGDHMSMYGVNGDIPKTVIRCIVRWYAEQSENAVLKRVLIDIIDTPVSPELLPAKDGEIAQRTEDLVGPYELHDFIIYYALRWGFTPEKILFLLRAAFAGVYDDATLAKWLDNFYRRFIMQQYKRSCLPDGPKVGSIGISPRGGFVMPSDANGSLWHR